VRLQARVLAEHCQQQVHGVAGTLVVAREEPGCCPRCDGPMRVQKSVPHKGNSISHGTFCVRETVHVCAARCRHPSGALVTRGAQQLGQLLIPNRTVSYDVMVVIGIQRYLHHRQREEIQQQLLLEHGIALSTGTISDLVRLFGEYLGALHEARAPRLRAAMQSDGGYPLHIDATGENGRGTLLIAYAGWRRWVLGAWKIPTERADAILPRLREVTGLFGPPRAIVRDLGRAMIPATAALVAELEQPIPILACHAHFLADIGKDLLEPAHATLRKLFRQHKLRPALRSLAREIGRKVGGAITEMRETVQTWQARKDGGHALPEGNQQGLGAIRSVAQWVLDYPDDSTGADFPFDRPYLDLHDRCIHARRAVDAFLRDPPRDREVYRTLQRLGRSLDPVADQAPFIQAARTLRRRAELFDELRAALRLHPKDGTGQQEEAGGSRRELQDIQAAVERLTLALQQRRPQRGPAQDIRQAIDEILAHLDRYGDSLWGHAIELPAEVGGGVRLVERTNNTLEGFNRTMKKGERRRSGRKTLTDDFEHLAAEAAIVPNLRCGDYVEIVCRSLERLPSAFAAIDEEKRRNLQAADPLAEADSRPHQPRIASASMPRADRKIVRSEAMANCIMAAARSRAPRISTSRTRV